MALVDGNQSAAHGVLAEEGRGPVRGVDDRVVQAELLQEVGRLQPRGAGADDEVLDGVAVGEAPPRLCGRALRQRLAHRRAADDGVTTLPPAHPSTSMQPKHPLEVCAAFPRFSEPSVIRRGHNTQPHSIYTRWRLLCTSRHASGVHRCAPRSSQSPDPVSPLPRAGRRAGSPPAALQLLLPGGPSARPDPRRSARTAAAAAAVHASPQVGAAGASAVATVTRGSAPRTSPPRRAVTPRAAGSSTPSTSSRRGCR